IDGAVTSVACKYSGSHHITRRVRCRRDIGPQFKWLPANTYAAASGRQSRASHVEPLEERALLTHGREADLSKLLGGPYRGAHFIQRARLTPAHGIARHGEQVGAKILFADRLHCRRSRTTLRLRFGPQRHYAGDQD